jgi:DNA-binding SARP family transcriptional activator
MPDGLEFRVLGPLEIVRDGAAVPTGSKQMRTVLAMLVLDAGRVVSSDRLIDDLWDEQPPASAANVLQVYVSRLRATLGPDILVTRAPGYVLDVDPGTVDAVRFERLATSGRGALREGRPDETAAMLRDALALWRGRVLEDVSTVRTESEAARLEELRLVVVEDRIDADLQSGAVAELVPELEVLTAEHPLRERLWSHLMRALYASGRRADALTTFDRVRDVLHAELGIEPAAELRALEDAIRRQDPALDAAAWWGPSSVAGPDAWLDIDGRPPVRLDRTRVVVGRAPGNDVVLADDPLVSHTHVVIDRIGAAWTARDLGSRNGTFLNGDRITAERVLRPGDVLRLGSTVLNFRSEASIDATVGGEMPPVLSDDEHQLLVEVCRPLVHGGPSTSIDDLAGTLGIDRAGVDALVDRLCEVFGVPPDIDDKQGVLASRAIERSAVSLSEVRPVAPG